MTRTSRRLSSTLSADISDGSGLPVLIVHGTPATARTVRPLVDAAAGRPVVAIDLPGHGDSAPIDAPPSRLLDALAATLIDALDTLGWPRCAAIGHSLGADLVLRASCVAPHRFARLLLITPSRPNDAQRATLRQHAALLDVSPIPDAIWDVFLGVSYSPSCALSMRERWLAESARVSGCAAALRSIAETPSVALSDVRVPCEVLVCSDDQSASPQDGETMAEALGAPLHRLPGRHYPFHEHPAQTAELVRAFLTRADAGRA